MKESITFIGFDGYNGDLTDDVVATLGINCGMSTGRNGVIQFINEIPNSNKNEKSGNKEEEN